MSLKNILYENRLILTKNSLYIEDYKKLDSISDKEIITNDYIILGSNLHIKIMDKHILVVNGQINEIRRKQ